VHTRSRSALHGNVGGELFLLAYLVFILIILHKLPPKWLLCCCFKPRFYIFSRLPKSKSERAKGQWMLESLLAVRVEFSLMKNWVNTHTGVGALTQLLKIHSAAQIRRHCFCVCIQIGAEHIQTHTKWRRGALFQGSSANT